MASEHDLKKDLRKKYKEIFTRERSLAQTVSHVMIKSRPVTVWEFLIPILLIFSFAKSRETREIFVQNFLFTKELALQGARDMVHEGITREDALSRVDRKTRKLLDSIKKKIYSEEVRIRQMEEMELLLDHYSRLFEAEGEDYESWLTHAYGSLGTYRAFLDSLKGAEKEVYVAAMKTVGNQGSTDMITRMEETTERVRSATAEKIFNSLTGR